MNKKELIRSIAKKFDLTLAKANEIVSAIIDDISKSLAKGKNAAFMGFGTFKVKKRKARKGRNPQTGETIKISARKIVQFVVGKSLNEIVNNKKTVASKDKKSSHSKKKQ